MPLSRLIWGLAAAPLALALTLSAAAAQETDLTGVWRVNGYTKEYGTLNFFVEIEAKGAEWEARKLNASRYVPDGRVHFRARLNGDTLAANVQVAFPNFAEPEWRSHSFALERGEDGKVTQMTLASGRNHTLDQTGEVTIQDRWTYTPWPASHYLLPPPRITDYAYRSARNSVQTDINASERSIASWQESSAAAKQRLERATEARQEAQGRVDATDSIQAAALEALLALKNDSGEPQPVDTSEMPSRLRVLYNSLEAERRRIQRAEKIILDHQNGVATQNAATIAVQFETMDSSRAEITRLQGHIATVREELGLGPEPDPNAGRPERLAALERAYESAADAYWEARRVYSRAAGEEDVARGQVAFQNQELEREREKLKQLRDELKGLGRETALLRIEGFIHADPGRLVYQAVPSGLDTDMRNLQPHIDEVRAQHRRAREQADDFMTQFREVFDEATALRERMAEEIWVNAIEMAAAQGTVKLAEIGIAFATGGPVGLAIELVTTPVFQHMLYEDGVVFENYDERALQGAYRSALGEATREEPDPMKACEDLNLRTSAETRDIIANVMSLAAVRARAFDTTLQRADIAPEVRAALGNPSQRIQSNSLHYTALSLANVGVEGSGEALERMGFSSAYDVAKQAAERQVALRARDAAAGVIQGVSQTGRQMFEEGVDAAARRAMMDQYLEQMARHSPEVADDLARGAAGLRRLMTQLEMAERAAEGLTDAAERRAAREAYQPLVQRIQERMASAEDALRPHVAAQQASRSLAQLGNEMMDPALSASARRAMMNDYLEQVGRYSSEVAEDLARGPAGLRRLMSQLEVAERAAEALTGAERRAAIEAYQPLVQRIQERLAASQASLRSAAAQINWPRTLNHQKTMQRLLAQELDNLNFVARALAKGAARAGLRNTLKGSAASVAASLVFAVALDANMSRLQQQEQDLWKEIFATEIQQTLLFKAWQRATCIEWALEDQFDELRRYYNALYAAYDPETGFATVESKTVPDNASLDLRLIYEPALEQGLETKVGEAVCPQTTQAGCRIASGGLIGQQGPYLAVDIGLKPPGD